MLGQFGPRIAVTPDVWRELMDLLVETGEAKAVRDFPNRCRSFANVSTSSRHLELLYNRVER